MCLILFYALHPNQYDVIKSQMSEAVTEFDFVSSLPQKKTRKGLIAQVKQFWAETDGGAVPIGLAAKMVGRSNQTITRWVDKGKLRAFKYGKQVLVQIDDLERLLDEPVDKGGRPRKGVK